jgi:purine-binding chemotaxis protein CheW
LRAAAEAGPKGEIMAVMDGLVIARTDDASAQRPAARHAPAAPERHRTSSPGEFLSFRLGAEEYGIDILKVQEIRSYEQPTRIANAPDFVMGVVNLRGVIVPIVDLRLKFGCESAQYDGATVVIVLNVQGRVIGAVADSVSDVIELAQAEIRPAPDMAFAANENFIAGIGSIQADGAARMLLLLDIDALMSSSDLGLVGAAA